MKFTQFYSKSKTPATLSNILDLAEEKALSYRNEDEQFSDTILPPTKATGSFTDEDCVDENGAGTFSNLPGNTRMLLEPTIICDSSKLNDKDIEEPVEEKSKGNKLTSHLGPGQKKI